MKYVVEVPDDYLVQIHEAHNYVGHSHQKPGEFHGADLIFHNVTSATLIEENEITRCAKAVVDNFYEFNGSPDAGLGELMDYLHDALYKRDTNAI